MKEIEMNDMDLTRRIVKPEYPHSVLTGRIINCAMEVHSQLGNGFPEVIYQRAFAIEMDAANLSFEQEFEMEVFYKGMKIGNRRCDFFVEREIMVETKAVSALDDTHLAQAINYLEASGQRLGLLINFGATSLEFKRIMPRQKINTNHPSLTHTQNHNQNKPPKIIPNHQNHTQS